MEENNELWEQPETLSQEIEEADGSQNIEQNFEIEDGTEGEAENGETIGKFKNAQALLDAYNNLEREFTKKSQRLAEIEKDKTQQQIDLDEQVDTKLKVFLSQNGEAEKYAEILKDEVLKNDALKKMEDPFSYAWAKVMFEKLKSKQADVDSTLSDYVLNNSNVKDVVIKNYVSQLAENYSPIKIASSGQRVANNVATKPNNIKEAKSVLVDLLS